MACHREAIVVRYAETDKMGVAHHSSYLLWFEIGRTGLLRAAGFSYRSLEAAGFMLPVVEYGARFMKGVHYDDTLSVETVVRAVRSRVVSFGYRVIRGDETVADGFTHHVCVDGENRPRRLPAGVMEAVSRFQVGNQ
jgi:acyl-CoA thioester hydrolase